ncbi:SH2 domain-containing protein 7 isoform X1 [Hippoglossus stenolepis]|uniref:SH2 domain-containing protein 7 isoform X1 n=1 Tax=Hippoglossus stenolepis TaxID=195615 RepID=UPI001FAFB453|nr:SH2 domain-containing protein 7 isoform X1 [Hippoglossus stenolepis]
MSSVYISSCLGVELPQNTFDSRSQANEKMREGFLMFAEMAPGSNPTRSVSGEGVERCAPYGRQKPRLEKIFSGSKDPKSPSFRNCLNLFFKDRARMEPREKHRSSHAEVTQGKLRELASKWFLETQVPHIVHNGLFPTWFLGFITRKDAEDILREKEPGCFLVRLSDKAIGYILSYKGIDRCRHFVINQNEEGQFVVCGDSKGHDTIPMLINFYMSSPIEPFGEFLTSSCSEVLNEELYDTIQLSQKEKPVASDRAGKNVPKQRIDLPAERPHTQPRQSNRTLEEVPPLPQRNRHFDNGPLHNQDSVLYAQLRKQSPREKPRSQHVFQGHLPGDNPTRPERSTSQNQTVSRCSPPSGQGPSLYPQLSLPESSNRRSGPDYSSDGEQFYRLTTPPHTPPRLSPKPVRQATRSLPQSDPCGLGPALYYLAGKSGSPHSAAPESSSLTSEQSSESLYAEVPGVALFNHPSEDNTYELIPVHEDSVHPKTNNNTYEPLEDFRPKVVKNEKRKWHFPEAKWKW